MNSSVDDRRLLNVPYGRNYEANRSLQNRRLSSPFLTALTWLNKLLQGPAGSGVNNSANIPEGVFWVRFQADGLQAMDPNDKYPLEELHGLFHHYFEAVAALCHFENAYEMTLAMEIRLILRADRHRVKVCFCSVKRLTQTGDASADADRKRSADDAELKRRVYAAAADMKRRVRAAAADLKRAANAADAANRKRSADDADRKRSAADADLKRSAPDADADRKRSAADADLKRSAADADRKRSRTDGADADRKRSAADADLKRSAADADRKRSRTDAEGTDTDEDAERTETDEDEDDDAETDAETDAKRRAKYTANLNNVLQVHFKYDEANDDDIPPGVYEGTLCEGAFVSKKKGQHNDAFDQLHELVEGAIDDLASDCGFACDMQNMTANNAFDFTITFEVTAVRVHTIEVACNSINWKALKQNMNDVADYDDVMAEFDE